MTTCYFILLSLQAAKKVLRIIESNSDETFSEIQYIIYKKLPYRMEDDFSEFEQKFSDENRK